MLPTPLLITGLSVRIAYVAPDYRFPGGSTFNLVNSTLIKRTCVSRVGGKFAGTFFIITNLLK